MRLRLEPFSDIPLTETLIESLIQQHRRTRLPRLDRLWRYYRNPASNTALPSPDLSPYAAIRLAQAEGLPARLRGRHHPLTDDRHREREVVIENDIAWRIDALVDFVFGKPPIILSAAPDPERRALIQRTLDAVLDASGGIALLQDALLLGAVHGHIDLLLRTETFFERARTNPNLRTRTPDELLDLARLLRIELLAASRTIPVLDPGDYRRPRALILHASAAETESSPAPSLLARLTGADRRRGAPATDRLELLSHAHRQVYINGELAEESINHLARLPIAHIQNAAQPFAYEGLSDVEPLIPLQNELNTRLSDRAHRVTLQSFRMYLAKGLDGFGEVPVRPGQVWSTDNPEASIEDFGGDSLAPSEERHIEDLRDAMDKLSSISPVALGVIRAKLGHLSSENALRITLMGVLSKTARKRVNYGRGIAAICEHILSALNIAGVLATTPAERNVRIQWPDPLPQDESNRLAAARLKLDVGVPRELILSELGYAPTLTPSA